MKDKCAVCNGRRYTKQKYMKVEYDELCSNCGGTGMVEWIDNIFPKKRCLSKRKKIKVVNLTDKIIYFNHIPPYFVLYPDTPKEILSVKLFDEISKNKHISILVKENKIYFYEVYE